MEHLPIFPDDPPGDLNPPVSRLISSKSKVEQELQESEERGKKLAHDLHETNSQFRKQQQEWIKVCREQAEFDIKLGEEKDKYLQQRDQCWDELDEAIEAKEKAEKELETTKDELETTKDELEATKRELQHYKVARGRLEGAKTRFEEECSGEFDRLQKIYDNVMNALKDATKDRDSK